MPDLSTIDLGPASPHVGAHAADHTLGDEPADTGAAPALNIKPNRDPVTLAIEIARHLADSRCTDVLILDVRGISQVQDCVVLGTGTSERQIRSVSSQIKEIVRKQGQDVYRSSSDDAATWCVIDCVDVVAHLFEPNARSYYDLESMWGDAPRISWYRPGEAERIAAEARDARRYAQEADDRAARDAQLDDEQAARRSNQPDDDQSDEDFANARKKPATKKPTTKKPAPAKEAASKKTSAKPAIAKLAPKPAGKKLAAKKPSAKSAVKPMKKAVPTKKASAQKTIAPKAVVKTAVVKKPMVKKSVVKKAVGKRAVVTKAPAQRPLPKALAKPAKPMKPSPAAKKALAKTATAKPTAQKPTIKKAAKTK